MTLQDLLNRRITTYLAACSEGKRHPDHIGMYYAGGTLCLDILFWKGTEQTRVVEVFLLNLNGHGNSTLNGDFTLSPENLQAIRKIYLESKGETDHYRESVPT